MFNLTTSHGPKQTLEVRLHDGTCNADKVAKVAMTADAICFHAPMSHAVVASMTTQPRTGPKIITAVMSHDTGGVNGTGWSPATWGKFCDREDIENAACVERDITNLVEFKASIASMTGIGADVLHSAAFKGMSLLDPTHFNLSLLVRISLANAKVATNQLRHRAISDPITADAALVMHNESRRHACAYMALVKKAHPKATKSLSSILAEAQTYLGTPLHTSDATEIVQRSLAYDAIEKLVMQKVSVLVYALLLGKVSGDALYPKGVFSITQCDKTDWYFNFRYATFEAMVVLYQFLRHTGQRLGPCYDVISLYAVARALGGDCKLLQLIRDVAIKKRDGKPVCLSPCQLSTLRSAEDHIDKSLCDSAAVTTDLKGKRICVFTDPDEDADDTAAMQMARSSFCNGFVDFVVVSPLDIHMSHVRRVFQGAVTTPSVRTHDHGGPRWVRCT